MGFSLIFMRIAEGDGVDADRAGLAAFLTERGLHIGGPGGGIVDQAGNDLSFDGSWSDLRVDPLDIAGHVTGSIDHATLSPAESSFIFDLCLAGGFLVVNPQADPMLAVPRRNHLPEDLPEVPDDSVAWVDSPAELVTALSGGFDAFQTFKTAVLAQDSRPKPEEPAS